MKPIETKSNLFAVKIFSRPTAHPVQNTGSLHNLVEICRNLHLVIHDPIAFPEGARLLSSINYPLFSCPMNSTQSQTHLLTSTVLACLLAGSTAFAQPQQLITGFAGTGVKGFRGDGGPASEAQLNGPNGIVRGPDGALYICDTGNQRIRKVTRDGTINTIAGNGEAGWSGDGGPA